MDSKFKHRRLNTVIWIILLLGNMEKVDGGISISPSVPAMGAVGDAVLTCDSSGLEGNRITSMQISRKRATETEFTLLASIYSTAVATVPPTDLTLTVTHNGIEPGEGLHSNASEFSVGDVIQLSCSGSIGSSPNQKFKWQRTPLSGFSAFNPYNPDAANENKGTVPASPVNCMYSRTATLSYNISQEDGNRDHVWGFKCEAEYRTQTQESLPYYITVPGGSTMTTSMVSTGGNTMTTPTDSTVSCVCEEDRLNTTAIIIGVVEAVIIVGLTAVVVFLLTRNNTSGQEKNNTRGTELSNYEDLGQRTPADYDVLRLPAAPAPTSRHKWNCLCP